MLYYDCFSWFYHIQHLSSLYLCVAEDIEMRKAKLRIRVGYALFSVYLIGALNSSEDHSLYLCWTLEKNGEKVISEDQDAISWALAETTMGEKFWLIFRSWKLIQVLAPFYLCDWIYKLMCLLLKSSLRASIFRAYTGSTLIVCLLLKKKMLNNNL